MEKVYLLMWWQPRRLFFFTQHLPAQTQSEPCQAAGWDAALLAATQEPHESANRSFALTPPNALLNFPGLRAAIINFIFKPRLSCAGARECCWAVDLFSVRSSQCSPGTCKGCGQIQPLLPETGRGCYRHSHGRSRANLAIPCPYRNSVGN